MVPKKPSKLLKTSKTTRTQIFNQTFGVEINPSVKKISLMPKIVKVKKAPVVNAY